MVVFDLRFATNNLKQKSVQKNQNIRLLTFLRDSFLASFMESLNILSRTSRLSLRYSINQSVQCLLRSHRIFGVHGSGFKLTSVLVAGILDAQEQHLGGLSGAGVASSGILHLGGI